MAAPLTTPISLMRRVCFSLLFASISSLATGTDAWLERVAPVIDGPERERYLALATEDERFSFREAFGRASP